MSKLCSVPVHSKAAIAAMRPARPKLPESKPSDVTRPATFPYPAVVPYGYVVTNVIPDNGTAFEFAQPSQSHPVQAPSKPKVVMNGPRPVLRDPRPTIDMTMNDLDPGMGYGHFYAPVDQMNWGYCSFANNPFGMQGN